MAARRQQHATSLLILEGRVLLPGAALQLRITPQHLSNFAVAERVFRAASGAAFDLAVGFQRGKDEAINGIGTACRVVKVTRVVLDNVLEYRLRLHGRHRVRIEAMQPGDPACLATVRAVPLASPREDGVMAHSAELRALADRFRATTSRLFALRRTSAPLLERIQAVIDSTPASLLCDLVASVLHTTFAEQLAVLNAVDLAPRLRLVTAMLEPLLSDRLPIVPQAQSPHRTPPLTEADGATETPHERLRARFDAIRAGMPEEAHQATLRELQRIQQLEESRDTGPEYHKTITYVEWMVDLPWAEGEEGGGDGEPMGLADAEQLLDADHYGLAKVKKRVLEYLALHRRNASAKGLVLLFVGPPGVGKTSLGKSIAKTLGRRFARLSLGGTRDEASIRGFHRTYVGSQPGNIIKAIRRAGTRRPVLLLDELDKLAWGSQGDPASALLEVLDPAQNSAFQDHYLGVPFDLSQVVFLATANTTASISRPLIDRLEVIPIAGYTLAEKLQIGARHLLPRQLREHGMGPEELVVGKPTIAEVCLKYTQEAGVRDLERKLAAICRATLVNRLRAGEGDSAGRPSTSALSPSDLEAILGPQLFLGADSPAVRVRAPGVAIGLSASSVGGRLLYLEAAKMQGTGKITLTGSLGDVLVESARLARSWVRAHTAELGLPALDWEAMDIHIHFPQGAVGKDGPSAGVALVVLLVSLLSNRCVRRDTAMTGELTLSGKVLPVGGIQQKILAAHRMGVRRVLLPELNHGRDLAELPEEDRSQWQWLPQCDG